VDSARFRRAGVLRGPDDDPGNADKAGLQEPCEPAEASPTAYRGAGAALCARKTAIRRCCDRDGAKSEKFWTAELAICVAELVGLLAFFFSGLASLEAFISPLSGW